MRTLAHQVRFDLLTFLRNPAASFFTVALPIIFLVLFTSVFGNETLDDGTQVSTLYVPSILALAIISATGVNLAITMATRRERGILKRLRGTPIRPAVFVAAQCVAGLAISAVMGIVMWAVGRAVFGVELALAAVPSVVVSIAVGAAAFSAVGLALTAIIPSENAAPAVTNAIFLPLYFVSDVFIPGDSVPEWIRTVAGVFPVQHLAHSFQDAWDPFATGTPIPAVHWAVLGAWGLAAAALAVRYFRWVPAR